MAKFTITVYDERGRHDHGVFEVEATSVLDAYGEALPLYLAKTGLKPYKTGTSSRQYYSQFYFAEGNDPQPEPNPIKVAEQGDKYLKQIREGRMGPTLLTEKLAKWARGHDGKFQAAVLAHVQAGL